LLRASARPRWARWPRSHCWDSRRRRTPPPTPLAIPALSLPAFAIRIVWLASAARVVQRGW